MSPTVTVTAALSMLLSIAAPERRRLWELTQASPVGLAKPSSVAASDRTSSWERLARRLAPSEKKFAKLRARYARAGYNGPAAQVIYTLAQFILPFALGLPPLALNLPKSWTLAAAGAIIGFIAPGLLLDYKSSLRKQQIENGLPDALDLMVVCIEAGCPMDHAIAKTGEELALAYPALAEEMQIMTTEVQAGRSRLEAFRGFAQRSKSHDVRSLVGMLVQTDRFVTSIAQALRIHADSSRTKRRQRAQERAHKVGVKLVFPLVLLLFPAFYIIILGPAVIQFVRVFMQW